MINPSVGILSVPFDLGIKLNNGRPGARLAPKEIKKELYKKIKKQKKRLFVKGIEVIDYGSVVPISGNVKATHEKVTAYVARMIKDGVIPIVLGGGHDISFGSIKAIFKAYKKIGQINIDAHYDVRPVVNGKITSGTPFRRLIDGGFLKGKNFVELGLHSPKNLKEHRDYLISKKATLLKMDFVHKAGVQKSISKALKISSKNTKAVVFDIDIDGVQKRFAPGCSAPCVQGFTKKEVLKAAYLAGKDKRVKMFNLMEVSPVYDVKRKTIILASDLVLEFIKGISERN